MRQNIAADKQRGIGLSQFLGFPPSKVRELPALATKREFQLFTATAAASSDLPRISLPVFCARWIDPMPHKFLREMICVMGGKSLLTTNPFVLKEIGIAVDRLRRHPCGFR